MSRRIGAEHTEVATCSMQSVPTYYLGYPSSIGARIIADRKASDMRHAARSTAITSYVDTKLQDNVISVDVTSDVPDNWSRLG